MIFHNNHKLSITFKNSRRLKEYLVNFSDNNGMKLEINNKKNTGKFMNT